MRSPIYAHPVLYRMVLKALYGGELDARFDQVLELLPREGSLLDVCAGDGAIAEKLARGVHYTGVDGNAAFVSGLKKRSLDAQLLNVRTDPLPRADTVLMMGSLYHFYPHHKQMIEKLQAAAADQVIVVEPHVNWSSKGGFFGWLAQRMSDPGIAGSHLGRLSAEDLEALAKETQASQVIRMEREYIIVWKIKEHRPSPA